MDLILPKGWKQSIRIFIHIILDSNIDISGYAFDLKTDVGEVEVGEGEYGRKYYQAGKNGSITARGDVGDISINDI